MQIEKTVFISYRRTNAMTARAVYQHLMAHGYDCFLDNESIDSGSFERIILNQIAARAHFLVILTPSALERCAEPDDWLRREIEYALDNGRNIVPLMFDGFRYSDVQKYLTGKLNVLPQYNSLEIPAAYFEEAMTRLEKRFLSKALDVILHPTSVADQRAVAESKAKVEQQPVVTEHQISAEEWFERALQRPQDDYDGQIADYSEALRLNPDEAVFYYNRGLVHHNNGDVDSAIADYSQAIRLNPNYAEAYNNRGLARNDKCDYDGAIADCTQSIELNNPRLHLPYGNRGLAYYNKGDKERAIADYNQAILLNPSDAGAYNNRGVVYYNKGDKERAIADYNQAILLNPSYAEAYTNRGNVYYSKGDVERAIADYNQAILVNPNFALAYNNRGFAYYSKNDYERAIGDYKIALQIIPNHTLAAKNLEIAYQAKASLPK